MTTYAQAAAFAMAAIAGTFAQCSPGASAPRDFALSPAAQLRANAAAAADLSGTCAFAARAAGHSGPLGELDAARAMLAAQGETYHGQTAQEVRDAIALLPAWTPGDGISAIEEAALQTLLRLGRQLVYAEAVAAVEEALNSRATGVLLADSSAGFPPGALRAASASC